MSTVAVSHGKRFADLFRTHWPAFWPERNLKRWNQEDRFRTYLQRNRLVDTIGGHFLAEFPDYAQQDVVEQIDYVLLASPCSRSRPQISDVVATCEFKGPARPTLWEFTNNWFGDAVLPDIRKQYRRSRHYPGAEHYFACVALLDSPKRKSVTRREMDTALASLSAEVCRRLEAPKEVITASFACLISEIDPDMILFVWRVGDAPSEYPGRDTDLSDLV